MDIEPLPIHDIPLQDLKYSLFLKRRFLPIFLATFLGAFNDNLVRSGLIVMIAYSASKGIKLPTQPEILVTICSALLMLPLILFSSIAGALADKMEKSRLVVYAKIAEVGIMAVVFWGFETHSIFLLMGMLFISGTHTTFYSPIKFSILPDHLRKKELLAGNGFMAGGSYLAILFGLIAGGLLVEYPGNLIGYAALIVSIAGLAASLFIPPSQIAHPEMVLDFNLWRGTKDIISYAIRDRSVMIIIFALSWFLLYASIYMSQFANYAQGVIGANNEVYILLLTVFSVGTAIGSLMCDTLLKGEISAKFTSYAALGLSFFTYILIVVTPEAHSPLLDAFDFLQIPQNWLVMGCMMMVALSGGIYIVPLYAMLQSNTPAQYRSRIMAASNLSDALFMTTAAIISTILLSLDFGILDLFTIIATLNLFVVWYARKVFS
jgi:acyl-[acyl-carrier-protein]-phospholipid O-acyltransferase / long-chain-fatty-acid--[acyl-carrier-protein] ligase